MVSIARDLKGDIATFALVFCRAAVGALRTSLKRHTSFLGKNSSKGFSLKGENLGLLQGQRADPKTLPGSRASRRRSCPWRFREPTSRLVAMGALEKNSRPRRPDAPWIFCLRAVPVVPSPTSTGSETDEELILSTTFMRTTIHVRCSR